MKQSRETAAAAAPAAAPAPTPPAPPAPATGGGIKQSGGRCSIEIIDGLDTLRNNIIQIIK